MTKNQLCLFLLGQKGLSVLKETVQSTSESTDLTIIVGQDSKIHDSSHTEMARICKNEGIQFFYNKNLDKKDINNLIQSSRLSIAVGWRQLLPSHEGKLIIFHDSLLPKYRGFNPLVTALIQGDKKIGVSSIWAADEYDSGQIIFQEETKIDYPITIQGAIEQITPLYAKLIKMILKALESDKPLVSYEQDHSNATYSLWRNQDDYYINWSEKATLLRRKIDASGYPYEGACTIYDERKIIIKKAEEIEDKKIINRTPGKVLCTQNNLPVVVCGEGLLLIKEAIYSNGSNALPLAKFRTRFRSQK